jgi:hypothetical protein
MGLEMKVEHANRRGKQENEARLLHLSRCLKIFFFFAMMKA